MFNKFRFIVHCQNWGYSLVNATNLIARISWSFFLFFFLLDLTLLRAFWIHELAYLHILSHIVTIHFSVFFILIIHLKTFQRMNMYKPHLFSPVDDLHPPTPPKNQNQTKPKNKQEEGCMNSSCYTSFHGQNIEQKSSNALKSGGI